MPLAGTMSDGARVHGGSAARRRDRPLRQWLRHERLSIRMCVAEMRHHAAPQPIFVHVGTQTAVYITPDPAARAAPVPVNEYVASAPVTEYVAPVLSDFLEPLVPVIEHVAHAPAVTYPALAPVIEYVAPTPAVTHEEPAPVIEYVAPSHVIEYIAQAPAVTYSAPCRQLPPAYTMTAVTTGVNLDITGLVNPQCSLGDSHRFQNMVGFLAMCSMLDVVGRLVVTHQSRVLFARGLSAFFHDLKMNLPY